MFGGLFPLIMTILYECVNGWLGIVWLTAAFCAELIALLQRALFWFCHLVRITMTICAVRYRGKDATYTQCTWTHPHIRTLSYSHLLECHRSGSPNVYSGLKWREYRTEAVMWKQDHLASHTAVHHFCAAQTTFSTIIQHFSTSAPFWPTLNITFIKWYVQADYIVDGLMLVIFTELYLSSKDILMCYMENKVRLQIHYVVLKHTWIYGWCL